MIKLKSLERVCPGCPMMWEGWTEDNLFVFIRYRWGFLRVLVGKTPNENYENDNIFNDSDLVYGKTIGDEYDGTMTNKEMMNHLKDILDFSLVKESLD
jgi:hypothetical protein